MHQIMIYLSQEAKTSGINIENEPQKEHPKLKKYILNFYREYLVCQQSNASGSFLKTCINFVEQQLKFSRSEGSIIPYASLFSIVYRFKESRWKLKVQ